MKKFLVVILSITMSVYAHYLFAQDNKTVTINASGSGKTQDAALQDALRNAIEQAFGAFISSKTEILNDQLLVDEIKSISNGNIQKYTILNESKFEDGTFANIVEATVSVTKLASFVESKGYAVEFKGGLFAINVKQQILNEEGEIKALKSMVDVLAIQMKRVFDYSIKTSEPIATSSDNSSWKVVGQISALTNANHDIMQKYLLNTLKSIAMKPTEVNDYRKLNKTIFPFGIFDRGRYVQMYMRKEESFYLVYSIGALWLKNLRSFSVYNDKNEPYTYTQAGVSWDYSQFYQLGYYIGRQVNRSVGMVNGSPDMPDPLSPFHTKSLFRKVDCDNFNFIFIPKNDDVAIFRIQFEFTLKELEKVTGFKVKSNNEQ